jgi:hypothetical protein
MEELQRSASGRASAKHERHQVPGNESPLANPPEDKKKEDLRDFPFAIAAMALHFLW